MISEDKAANVWSGVDVGSCELEDCSRRTVSSVGRLVIRRLTIFHPFLFLQSIFECSMPTCSVSSHHEIVVSLLSA